MREIAKRHGRAIYCHHKFVNCQVTGTARMQQAVSRMPLNEQRAILSWLSKHGPFWDDDRQHSSDDLYEYNGGIVTDTAVGETAHYVLNGIDRSLISMNPSHFNLNPIVVDHVIDDTTRENVGVKNYWEPTTFESVLTDAPPVISSWAALSKHSRERFDKLIFTQDTFKPLHGEPFRQAVAERIIFLLEVLQRLKLCFDKNGARTAKGEHLYQSCFIGHKPLFTDSSDPEKRDFKKELTFPHPNDPDTTLFCSWHGKINSPKYRIHFSWPVTATTDTYVVYVGPKITKK